MPQLSFLDEVARANQDEFTVDPAHIRKQQMDASWTVQKAFMIQDWQTWHAEALAQGNEARAAFCLDRLAFLERI